VIFKIRMVGKIYVRFHTQEKFIVFIVLKNEIYNKSDVYNAKCSNLC